MRCENCGGIIGSNITKINGVPICERCARSFGIDIPSRMKGFANIDALANAFMASGADLDFTRSKISCPRCGTGYREFEMNNRVGCIECYNFFNNLIVKTNLRLQGSSEYRGRQPGQKADILPDIDVSNAEEENNVPTDNPFVQPLRMNNSEDKSEDKSKAENTDEPKKSLYEKLQKADLGMVSDEDLENAMKQAAEAEDYAFAAKLRDELKSRKEENKDVE